MTTDANGRYEVSFTAEECAVADRGGSGGIILRFDLGYSDGKADSKWRQTESYVWDCVRPDAPKADLTQLESESRSLTGTAEPNAMIYAALGDDSTLGAAFAEEDGSFTLSWNQALEVGDVVRLTAFDGAGNASPELALPVVQLVHQAGKIGVADRVYKSDEVLAVSGFFACRREDADIIRLVWSDAAGVSEREITMIPGSNDDNVRAQKALSGYPLGDDVTYVQAFTAHVPLSDCESGTYRLMLRREAWGEDIIVMDEAEVQVERVGMTAGGGEGAVSAAAATWTVLSQGGYAIGFDAPQRAQSGDDVILTGTIYTTVSDHAIRRVYVNSDIDTDEQQVYDSERDFDVAEVHSVEELLSADGACVLWLDRSLDGVPGRIVDELGGINASSTNAGFVLRIRGEDLQNGDTLMLRTQVGQMLYGGEVRLSIGGSGYAAVTEALISQLTAGWTTSADGG